MKNHPTNPQKFYFFFVSQPIWMKFGTRLFSGLLKPNLKSTFRNFKKGALGEEMGGLQKFQKICISSDFDKFGTRWFFGLI